MGRTISRQALYEAVWAQPMSRLSKEFGLSDVGLAKACRKLSVPLPPRGYWARKAAGKQVVQVALPPRPPGLGEETTIGGGGRGIGWGWSGPSDDSFLGDVPPTPSFDEPIGQVQARVEAAIGKTAVVQRDLAQPHPLVAKLLQQYEERRAAGLGQSYIPAWEKVLYDTPIQQRRLRLLSSILMTAARCGCRGNLGVRPEPGHPQENFSLAVGDQWVGFRVAIEGNKPASRGKTAGPKAASTIQVSLEDRVWEDVHTGDAAIVREIAVALILRGEEAHRERAISGHAWWMGRRAAVIERRRKEAEEAARRERERLAAIERKRVERLLNEADALRNARAIRAYVEEVRAADPMVPQADLDAWTKWALEQADRIDPVLSGSFLKGLAEM